MPTGNSQSQGSSNNPVEPAAMVMQPAAKNTATKSGIQKALFALAFVIVITGLSVGAVYWNKQQGTKSTTKRNPKAIEAEKAAPKAFALVSQHKYDEAYTFLDDAIKNADSNQIKANLYNEKATAGINAKNYQVALDAAKHADELAPSVASASLAATASEGLGNKPLAVEYLKKQLERMSRPNSTYYGEDFDLVRKKIKDLGGQ